MTVEENIDLQAAFNQFRRSWFGEKLNNYFKKIKKYWYLLLVLLLIASAYAYHSISKLQPHFETYLVVKSRITANELSYTFIHEYLSMQKAEFMEKTGIKDEEFELLKQVDGFSLKYRHDWGNFTNDLDSAEKAVLTTQYMDVFLIESQEQLDKKHQLVFQKLLNNIPEIVELGQSMIEVGISTNKNVVFIHLTNSNLMLPNFKMIILESLLYGLFAFIALLFFLKA